MEKNGQEQRRMDGNREEIDSNGQISRRREKYKSIKWIRKMDNKMDRNREE